MPDTTISGLPLNESFDDADIGERERDLAGTPQNVKWTFAGLVTWLLTKITPAGIGAATTAAVVAAQATADAALPKPAAGTTGGIITDVDGTGATVAISTATVASLQSATSTAQSTANAALPKPGGTTTDGGIVTGSGTAGAAVAVSAVTLSAITTAIDNNAIAAAAAQSTANAAIPKPGGATVDGTVVAMSGTAGAAVASSTKVVADLVTNSGTSVAGNLPKFSDTSGEVIEDSLIPSTFVLYAGGVQAAHATSTKTLAATDVGARIPIDSDTIAGDCTITVPDSLTAGFYCELRLDGTGGDILFAASGTQVLDFYGQATCTVEHSIVGIFIESATRAEITIVEPA